MGGAELLISVLDDDVLLHILELLPDARDVVRTGALSRRWRGLWTRLPALRFASSTRPEFSSVDNGSQRYIDFVNDAVALSAAQTEPALQRLAISFTMTSLLQRCFEAAQGWIRYAVRNEMKSFVLELDRPSNHNYDAGIFDNNGGYKKEQFLITLEDLPSSAKMETMRLALDGAAVRLPAAATFTALMDLSLENMEFKDGRGSGRLLNRLLSPVSCPRLRKLSLRDLRFTGLEELLLEAETLLELSMEDLMWEPQILSLRAPSLRVLRVVACDHDMLTLSAPRLEKILFLYALPYSEIDINGELQCVRSLKVDLVTHAFRDDHVHEDDDEDMNAIGIRLLNCCTSATYLDVDLIITQKFVRGIDIIKGRVPRLPQVTSLAVQVFQFELHSFGAGMADILRQCSNLKYLRIHSTFKKCDDLKTHFLCDHPDHWKFHEVYVPHLKEAEFTGLVGTECELRLMQYMLTGITQIQKVTICFDPKYSLITNRIKAFEHIRQLAGGVWNSCNEAYLSLEWKPCL